MEITGEGIEEIPYWSRPYLRTLWRYIKRGDSKYEKIMTPSDETFFRGQNGYLKKYFEPVKKED